MIKAIETAYNGYRFRSRLEARWAVFFDTLGIKYVYEPEGFQMGNMRYLPDFWLTELGAWIEIKPQEPTKKEIRKAEELTIGSQHPCFLISGSVGIGEYRIAACLPVSGWMIFDKIAMCNMCQGIWLVCVSMDCYLHPYDCGHLEESTWINDAPRLIEAYSAARQARFEHGERP